MRTYTLSLAIVSLAAALIASVFLYTTNVATGSVITGGEYNAIQLTSSETGTTSVKTLPGSIGSVVISNSSTAANISFYASTTGVTATSSGDLLFSVDAAATEGTYQYDVAFASQLIVDVDSAFDGNIVVTYR